MNTAEILRYAREQDVRLWIDGDSLKLDAPRSVVTPRFRRALKQLKPELIAVLGRWQKKEVPALDFVTCRSCMHWQGISPCGAGMITSGDPIPEVRVRLCGFHTPWRKQ